VFLTAWNPWAYTVLILRDLRCNHRDQSFRLLGAPGQQLLATAWFTPAVSVTALVGVTLVSVFGLRVAKSGSRTRAGREITLPPFFAMDLPG
jgi:hypothetical protein